MRVRLLGAGLVLLSASSAAAQAPVTGKLSKTGFEVIALSADGRAAVVDAKPRFTLRPPAGTVTLHLRDARGRYAGPIVVGGAGNRVILGVKAGARLGKIRVGGGYGRTRVAKGSAVASRWARASKGRPLGARNLGRVQAVSKGSQGAGLDADRDGVPGAFDVDDDGDLRLDSVDRDGLARAAQSVTVPDVAWIINGGLQVSCLAEQQGITKGTCGYTTNLNAAGPFAEDAEFAKLIDLLMTHRGALLFGLPGGDAELDCGGLSYCSPGGSGGLSSGVGGFPSSVDADGDGHGTMAPVSGFNDGQDGLAVFKLIDPSGVFGLKPNAGADAVRAGDTFIEKSADGDRPVTLNTVFGTLPALKAWSDGTRSETVEYPRPTGAEGSESNGYSVNPGADGHYRVTLTVWRPQRRAIPNSGEGDGWIDMGGLTYSVVGKTAEANRKVWVCPDAAYTTSDPNLTPGPGGMRDGAADAQVNADNTLTFTVDLTECLKTAGLTEFDRTNTVFISARSAAGDTAEGGGFSFRPQVGGAGSGDFGGTWRWTGGSPGTGIEFTAQALRDTTATQFYISFYNGLHVTGGTPPTGWTCTVGRTSYDADSYGCQGATLAKGNDAKGSITLDAPGTQGMTVMLVPCVNDVCQAYGLRYSP